MWSSQDYYDVVEDTKFTLSDIRDRFGDEVATLVNGASEPEELVNADKGKNWRERKVHTIEFIKGAGHDMKLLTCADKLANIRDIIRDYDRLGEDVWKIFNAPKEHRPGIIVLCWKLLLWGMGILGIRQRFWSMGSMWGRFLGMIEPPKGGSS